MNVVVPMAGRSTGFLRSKFKFPRYGLRVNGSSVLQRALAGIGDANYYFICLKAHFTKFGLHEHILGNWPKAKILLVDKCTEGQACSALWANQYVGNDDPLLIVSPMQVIDWNPADFFAFCENSGADAATVAAGSLMSNSQVFHTKVDFEHGTVSSISETYQLDWSFDCGIYYFRYGQYFTRWCHEMISRNTRISSEFWVAPCMNYGIVEGRTIRPYMVDRALILRKPSDVRQLAKDNHKWA